MQAQQTLLITNREHVASENFAGETVLVHFESGKYFNLSGSATLIWERLSKGKTVNELAEELSTYYRLEKEELLTYLKPFIETLQAERLLIEASSPAPDHPLSGSAEFAPPTIEAFSDLQELIYLDPVHDTDPARGWPRPCV